MLCQGRSQLTMFLIFALHSCLRSVAQGRNSLEQVFGLMRWSFDALFEGKWPSHDCNNVPMAYNKAPICLKVFIVCLMRLSCRRSLLSRELAVLFHVFMELFLGCLMMLVSGRAVVGKWLLCLRLGLAGRPGLQARLLAAAKR